MQSNRTFLTLGIVFLATGATFLIVGLTTHMLVMWSLGPAFIVLGGVFMGVAMSRNKRGSSTNSPAGRE